MTLTHLIIPATLCCIAATQTKTTTYSHPWTAKQKFVYRIPIKAFEKTSIFKSSRNVRRTKRKSISC